MKEITKDEYLVMVYDLTDNNWKAKALIRDFGGYENCTDHVKGLIRKALGVSVVDGKFYIKQ